MQKNFAYDLRCNIIYIKHLLLFCYEFLKQILPVTTLLLSDPGHSIQLRLFSSKLLFAHQKRRTECSLFRTNTVGDVVGNDKFFEIEAITFELPDIY